MKKRAAFFTLGCKVNFCDTESLQKLFEQSGYRIVDFYEESDVYVINTCTVTGHSDHKSRKAIRRARRRTPQAVVVATGCYAQGAPGEVKQIDEQPDLIIGNQKRENLPELVESISRGQITDLVKPHQAGSGFELLPPTGRRGRTRGFLKIQEGCNQICSYCIVPRVRGPLRSMPASEVLKRAEILTASGCREIVLTGVHLGLYGKELDNSSLPELLNAIEQIPGLKRLRLSSLEPSDINSALVEQIVASRIICPHLHIPLQSGDGEILRRMNRPYEPIEFLYLAKWLKQEIPGLSLSTDVIVGFPGETEKHHQRSMKLLEEIGFSRLHVFKYSSRPGTAAAKFSDHLPNQVKDSRSREMIELGEKMASDYRQRFIGTIQSVLVEKVVPYSYGEGFTPHYLRVKIDADIKGLHWRGKEIDARLEQEEGNCLRAVHIKKSARKGNC
ncbi:MAG: tRNA (N(6)-L-threonylcarbamoyladenosine(37)-C(2))-methylthiotransferase MtaB [Bacillota bacterium]